MSLDNATGFGSRNVNIGKIRNTGVEFQISGTPIKTRDWQWDLTWNIAHNKSKVVSLSDEIGDEVAIFGFTGGTSLYAIKGKPLGVYKDQKLERDPEGHVVVSASTVSP